MDIIKMELGTILLQKIFMSAKINSNHNICLPTTALFAEEMTFLDPDGSLTLDFLVSGLWEMTVA